MGQLACSARYSVARINSSLLTTTLYSSVITTLVYKDAKYSVLFMMSHPSSIVFCIYSTFDNFQISAPDTFLVM